jgi:glucokinase
MTDAHPTLTRHLDVLIDHTVAERLREQIGPEAHQALRLAGQIIVAAATAAATTCLADAESAMAATRPETEEGRTVAALTLRSWFLGISATLANLGLDHSSVAADGAGSGVAIRRRYADDLDAAQQAAMLNMIDDVLGLN